MAPVHKPVPGEHERTPEILDEAYPQFKNVRFDTETGVLIDKTEGKGSGIKKCLEGYTSLRWCPDQGHGARIELVRNPVENDLVRALHAWLTVA